MCHHYLIGRLPEPTQDDAVEVPPAEDEIPPNPVPQKSLVQAG
jgi:hypothetical protein